MGRHRAVDPAPSREWIEKVLGGRHRLSLFHDPALYRDGAVAPADRSALLVMFPTQADVEDYTHRDDAYRNLGTSAALHVVREVFTDFDSYVLRLSHQRVVEHRPMRAEETLHSDVFIETHESVDGTDVFEVRVVFTDTIGAMVFTNFATFVGSNESPVVHEASPEREIRPDAGIAASS